MAAGDEIPEASTRIRSTSSVSMSRRLWIIAR